MTDLTKITIENILINTSFSGYTNMEMDVKNQWIFLTNETEELIVYSMKISPSSLVSGLQTYALSSKKHSMSIKKIIISLP